VVGRAFGTFGTAGAGDVTKQEYRAAMEQLARAQRQFGDAEQIFRPGI
jgi:hypothetical protein